MTNTRIKKILTEIDTLKETKNIDSLSVVILDFDPTSEEIKLIMKHLFRPILVDRRESSQSGIGCSESENGWWDDIAKTIWFLVGSGNFKWVNQGFDFWGYWEAIKMEQKIEAS